MIKKYYTPCLVLVDSMNIFEHYKFNTIIWSDTVLPSVIKIAVKLWLLKC